MIKGILGKKDDSAAKPADDVPDELPSLAEDVAKAAAPSAAPAPAPSAPAASPVSAAPGIPEELPPLDAPIKNETPEAGTLADLEKETIPDAIKKAKMAKAKVEAPKEAIKELPKDEPKIEKPLPPSDYTPRERIQAGQEAGFFSNVLDQIRKQGDYKGKLLSGDLFLRMNNYWDIRKHEIKSGMQLPAERALEDDLMKKLEDLKEMERKWQVQRLALEADLKFLHEREREIQSKVEELKLISNELNLYKEIKPNEYFYMHNGVVLKSLHDLIDALEVVDDDTFNFHVSEHKNDFAKWVAQVFKDNHLAGRLQQSKSRAEMIEVIEKIPLASDHESKIEAYMSTDPKRYFWLSNGALIRNIFELADALRIMDDGVFAGHVNEQKNDFANWVRHSLNNEMLAQRLSNARSRRNMIDVLEVFL
jgi:hypothetical protein